MSMRVSFQQELAALESSLLEESELVRRALRGAVNALREGDAQLADEVIAFDDEVDRAYIAVEQGLETLLARQTPVAVDLRLVLAMLHINLHLERMADYCVTIAKLVKLAEGLATDPAMLGVFEEMGERAEEMLRVAINSFSARNVARAESLVDLDEMIDRANRRAVEQVLELAADPKLREWGLRMLMVSRCLERIGDHAVDIGEQTAYLVTAQFREFTDASDTAKR
jgi:phosphate transport system protein